MTLSTVKATIRGKNRLFYALFRLFAPAIKDSYYLAAAYAYMRRLDDIVDNPGIPPDVARAVVAEQRARIDALYQGEPFAPADDHEVLLAEFVAYDLRNGQALRRPLVKMLDSFSYDLERLGCVIDYAQFQEYSLAMADAFTEFVLHFLGYPRGGTPELARLASAACQAYMLRDLREDLRRGYINIDAESIARFGLDVPGLSGVGVRPWLEARLAELEREFRLTPAVVKQAPRLRDRLLMLLFVEPRRQALVRIARGGYKPLDNPGLVVRDYASIGTRIVASLVGR